MNSELSMDQVLIEKLTKILEVNLDKEHFGVKEFAIKAGLSRSKLHRKLKKSTGKSASKFIREFRLQKAMVMLQNNVATASEIAYQVGFGSPTYFNKCFHDYYGYPPGEVKFRNLSETVQQKDSDALYFYNEDQNNLKKHSLKKRFLANRLLWINTIAIILIGAFSIFIYQKYSRNIVESELETFVDKNSLAILHFKNLTGLTENEIFTNSLKDQILNELSNVNYLKVKSGQSSIKYENSELSILEIGNELQVNYLVEGSLIKNADSLRLLIQLIDAKNDKNIWANKYDFKSNEIFSLQNSLCEKISEQLLNIISNL